MDRMSYFLFKTEPDAYSFDDFLRDKETVWDGVTNPTAVKYLREMKTGRKVDLLPHRRRAHRRRHRHRGQRRRERSQGAHRAGESRPAPQTPKTLQAIKAEPLFADSPLVKIGRLSVVPLTEEQWEWFLK